MPEPIQSLALSCQIALNLHALNNEETTGNELKTRKIGIVIPDPSDAGRFIVKKVNALSGDMLKRNFLIKFRDIAEEWELPISPDAKTLDVTRAESLPSFKAALKRGASYGELYDQLLACALTDIAGILLTYKGQPLSRKSVIEFALAPAIPFHDYDTSALNHSRTPSPAMQGQSNATPMLFVRPVSSAVYAFTVRVNVHRIGYNEVLQSYPESVDSVPINRSLRFRALLVALVYSLNELTGALTSTQLPHRSVVDGYFSVSSSRSAPATLLSALSGESMNEINEVTIRTNRLQGYEAVKNYPFSGDAGLIDRCLEILERYEPSI